MSRKTNIYDIIRNTNLLQFLGTQEKLILCESDDDFALEQANFIRKNKDLLSCKQLYLFMKAGIIKPKYMTKKISQLEQVIYNNWNSETKSWDKSTRMCIRILKNKFYNLSIILDNYRYFEPNAISYYGKKNQIIVQDDIGIFSIVYSDTSKLRKIDIFEGYEEDEGYDERKGDD